MQLGTRSELASLVTYCHYHLCFPTLIEDQAFMLWTVPSVIFFFLSCFIIGDSPSLPMSYLAVGLFLNIGLVLHPCPEIAWLAGNGCQERTELSRELRRELLFISHVFLCLLPGLLMNMVLRMVDKNSPVVGSRNWKRDFKRHFESSLVPHSMTPLSHMLVKLNKSLPV